MSGDTYEVFARVGECMVCHERHDLRCGACFDCADKVDGRPLPGGKGHQLWEIDNPENTWIVGNP